MRAVFVELPAFARYRSQYLTDEEFSSLQQELLNNPGSGVVMRGTGGLRKIRFTHALRGKGKRGGLRIIYFWWEQVDQFWLFTLYAKGDVDDLTHDDCLQLRQLLHNELELRR